MEPKISIVGYSFFDAARLFTSTLLYHHFRSGGQGDLVLPKADIIISSKEILNERLKLIGSEDFENGSFRIFVYRGGG